MAVDSTNPVYDLMLPLWTTMRDVANGERAVKDKDDEYLPKLGGQDEKEYSAYKCRASFFGATGRTIDGLSGMVFRKPPEQKIPASMDEFMQDVTMSGLDFQGFAEAITDEVLTPGRCGILVDFPQVESGEMTKAQADSMNLRPYFSQYKAESILDWRVGRVGNKTVLTQVRLMEEASEPEDEFTERMVDQIRVLDLDDTDHYRQRIYRKEDESGKKLEKWTQFGEDIVPLMRGARPDFIPFIFVGPRDCTPNVCKPPLIDLADKNLDHYRMDADYKHSLHFIAAGSTRWVKGVRKEEIDEGRFDSVGPTALLATESPEAEFGISEPSGQGIPTQRIAIQDAEQQMAVLGARMLSPEKRQAEAAETAAIHRQGESSVLSSLATAVSIALTKALEIARDWMGLSEEIFVRLNTDYVETGLNAQELVALTGALQGGGISQEAYLEALIDGEILRPELTVEDELKRLMNNDFQPRTAEA